MRWIQDRHGISAKNAIAMVHTKQRSRVALEGIRFNLTNEAREEQTKRLKKRYGNNLCEEVKNNVTN
jgi:hypothetical protein